MEVLEDIWLVTNTDFDPTSVKFGGLQIGDSIDQISPDIITENQFGNWTHTNRGISYRSKSISDPTIIEVRLDQKALPALEIKSLKHLDIVFGNSDLQEVKSGTLFLFYPDRKLVVGWDTKKSELTSLSVGDHILKPTTYRAIDFLLKFYDLKGLSPDVARWQLSSFADNPPRYHRLRELQALMRAFGLKGHPSEFSALHLVENRDIMDFQPILEDIKGYVRDSAHEKSNTSKDFKRLARTKEFYVMLLQSFLRFSEEVRKLLEFNDGWQETSSIAGRYTIDKTSRLLKGIRLKELEEIETLICSLIDPCHRVYTKSELVENYDFPEEDLADIDLDYY